LRQSAGALGALAAALDLTPGAFRTFLDDRDRPIDAWFVVDVVAAFVREFAVDPQWLLTGNYDGVIHRHALILGEDHSAVGARTLREFIRQQYERHRNGVQFPSGPPNHDHE